MWVRRVHFKVRDRLRKILSVLGVLVEVASDEHCKNNGLFRVYICVYIQGGPLPVISEVINPISRAITPVTHL